MLKPAKITKRNISSSILYSFMQNEKVDFAMTKRKNLIPNRTNGQHSLYTSKYQLKRGLEGFFQFAPINGLQKEEQALAMQHYLLPNQITYKGITMPNVINICCLYCKQKLPIKQNNALKEC